MNPDDVVKRAFQRIQSADEARLAENVEVVKAVQASVYGFLAQLRDNVPLFLQKAEHLLESLVEQRRREAGLFRKHLVVEDRKLAGWFLTSWKQGGHWDTVNSARLYLLPDRSLILYIEPEFSSSGPPRMFGNFVPVSDDALVGKFSSTYGLDQPLIALYEAAGLPLPRLATLPSNMSSDDLSAAFKALGLPRA